MNLLHLLHYEFILGLWSPSSDGDRKTVVLKLIMQSIDVCIEHSTGYAYLLDYY